LAAQPIERRAFHPLNCSGCLLRGNVDQFRKRTLGQGETLVQTAHDEGRNDSQRKRNTQPQRGSFTRVGVDLDLAANLFHVGLDHVHAHAAAAHIGDCLGG
jgi:hypothetical protein